MSWRSEPTSTAYAARPPHAPRDAQPGREQHGPQNAQSHRTGGAVRRSREMAWLPRGATVLEPTYPDMKTMTQEGGR